ncbi:MAG: cupin domain-containing protein [Candidatus Binatota bacterium]
MEIDKSVQPQIIRLRTQLVKKGRSRELLSETDYSTFRIHCYATGTGENALHAHLSEDHVFVVLKGTATFGGLNGEIARLGKNNAIVLPKGCFYQFANYGEEPLVMIRFGAHKEKIDHRINPDGKQIGGRASEGYGEPELIENAFFE